MWSGPNISNSPELSGGKYRLITRLGQGATADVYLAARQGPGGFSKLVVIKRLLNLEDPQAMAMFLDEARLARRLSHPNIVQTYEICRDLASHFIVMEYLHGPTLRQLRALVDPAGGVPWAIEIEVMCNVLDGLHYAHELPGADGELLQVVHRDLCAENVIVTPMGECKILDFGIAKAIDSLSSTRAGSRKGRLRNMPPEQARGQPVDRRADLFAAGVMLWEGLSRQSLWGDATPSTVSRQLTIGQIPPLESTAREVPADLRAICARALHPDAAARFATALEFKQALLTYSQRHQLAVHRAELGTFVEKAFAEDAARLDAIILSQVVGTAQPTFAPLATSPPRALAPLGAPPPVQVATAVLQPRPGLAWPPDPGAPPLPPASRRTRAVLGSLAAVAAIFVAVVALQLWAPGGPPPRTLPPLPAPARPALAPPSSVPDPTAAAPDDPTARPPDSLRNAARTDPTSLGRHRPPSDPRARAARLPAPPAPAPPPRKIRQDQPARESERPPVWDKRALDASPYGETREPPPAKPARRIDRRNPWRTDPANDP